MMDRSMYRQGQGIENGSWVKGLTSVVDNSCRSWDSNPQPRVTSPTLYPLEPQLPLKKKMCANLVANYKKRLNSDCQQGFATKY